MMTSLSMGNLKIEYLQISDLKPYEKNARTHSKKQIAESIKAFGFYNPVLIDAKNMIIPGHGRVEAVKLLKLNTVPSVRLEHTTDSQKRAYILARLMVAQLEQFVPD